MKWTIFPKWHFETIFINEMFEFLSKVSVSAPEELLVKDQPLTHSNGCLPLAHIPADPAILGIQHCVGNVEVLRPGGTSLEVNFLKVWQWPIWSDFLLYEHGPVSGWSHVYFVYRNWNKPKWPWWYTGTALYMYSGLILGLHPANERRCYCVTTSLIGWAHT